VALLHADKTTASAEKMQAWERHELLRSAQALRGYLDRMKMTPTDKEQDIIDFIAREEPNIQAEVARHFGGKKAPQRWFNKPLLDAAKDADQKACAERAYGYRSFENYRLRLLNACA